MKGTIEAKDLEDLISQLNHSVEEVQTAINKHNALVKATLGSMPKNEIQLAEFIKRVIKYDQD